MFKIYHFYFSFLSLNSLNKDQWLQRSTVKRSADKEINEQKDQLEKDQMKQDQFNVSSDVDEIKWRKDHL